ncbi:hypothetical protein EYZ11_005331 [Aspergillus tanneri]|uniref:Uncharacterized protein n=1 Tax=Aspergillus tanneri TaxID=1220188 RepID=A0A4S3JIJ5_9EURO|nr:uncharacterized protein ATNIH1004_001035 [Aspergillus tanneri]KAA8652131.1 hypothetical protein ATNIH1004_001035 [Aspergillus tanneri]THC95172.1 hypothetical protein EYZ11_005331 [Aspergillus tanneri]
MPTILLVGTLDSKGSELCFIQRQIQQLGVCSVLLLDVGRGANTTPTSNTDDESNNNTNIITIQPPLYHPPLSRLSRADYIGAVSEYATVQVTELYHAHRIHGIVGIGGSCGTNIATTVMRRALPVGFPKLMVSTMASGNVRAYIEETDITMMYTVVDIAGTNSILNRILSNAAAAINGMTVSFYSSTQTQKEKSTLTGPNLKRIRIGITMFGVTTPAVDRIREYFETHHVNYEVYVFHATGAGGKAMERLIRERQLDAVLDLTTTEVVDELLGGVLSAGTCRLDAAAQTGIPQLVSVGACDMINFGPRDELPSELARRCIYEHNPTVTLVRTTAEESRRVARWMAGKLRSAVRPDRVRLLLPVGGVSLLDTPGQPFHDPEADEALFTTLEAELHGTGIAVARHPSSINEDFAVAAAQELVRLIAMD